MPDIDALIAKADDLMEREEWSRAAEAWQRVVDAADALDPEPNFEKAELVACRAACLSRCGRHAEASTLFADVHDYFCSFAGEDGDEALTLAGQWALAEAAAGVRPAGIERLRKAIAVIVAAPDASSARTQLTVVQRLARLLQDDGATDAAMELQRAWAARFEALSAGDGERRYFAGQLYENLGEHAVRAGRHEVAVEALGRCIDHYEAVWGKGDDTTASALRTLAAALEGLGQHAAADDARRRADRADGGG
jgi:tetratricopeptide (TPR) repeat protein